MIVASASRWLLFMFAISGYFIYHFYAYRGKFMNALHAENLRNNRTMQMFL